MANIEKKPEALVRHAPQVVGDPREHAFVSPHDMTEDVDPAYAGEYELTRGYIRIADPSDPGSRGKVYRGRQYRTIREAVGNKIVEREEPTKSGAKIRLDAIDAYRFLLAGVVKRIDGKKPDRLPEVESN